MRGVAVEIVERAAEGFFALDAENNAGNLIHVRNDAVGVDQYDAVFEALNNRFGFAFLIDEPIDIEPFELLKPLSHSVELRSHGLEFSQRLLTQPERRAAEAKAAQVIGQLGQRP